ncbi:aminoglycoside phosphotransferase family protein [Georgenia muralis]|uniref:Aminoglycoside phosphotransferase (APT) family kinase protein n=1 Tax=Georgenia muralis TaxID=154117 RepID=A0A3N4Z3Z1_9MICO|nr:aminoglycoside phosphotransferase family protein [Georgenia muralis]RPF28039.1 aminoglycoside phosphotransferase (APT) family kinase protein [Georgenia muralis]
MARTPSAELDVGADVVRRLLADQHPDLAELPLGAAASGWDNLVHRLGDRLAVRTPRRQAAAALVRHEQRWLPGLAPGLPVRVPVPVRTGTPTTYYPWHWSVVPWFPGVSALTLPPERRDVLAPAFADFLLALHRPAPPGAPHNPVRGVPLGNRDDVVRERLAGADARLVAVWDRALAAPAWDGPALWLHGDPHPANLVVDGGRLAAVVDFGDLTAGDPATDLAAAWLVFGKAGRQVLRSRVGPSPDTWVRAAGWALAIGSALVTTSDDAPAMRGVGDAALAALAHGDRGAGT